MIDIDYEKLEQAACDADTAMWGVVEWDNVARAVVAALGEQGLVVVPSAPFRRVIVDLAMARRCVPTDSDLYDRQTAYEALVSWITAMKQEDIVALQAALVAPGDGGEESNV